MALTESIEYDKIEVVGQYKHVQVRKAPSSRKMVQNLQDLLKDMFYNQAHLISLII